jgi:hypothetical protein
MFLLNPIDQAKLAALRAIGDGDIQVAELVAVYWPAPDGTIYYTQTYYDELPEYKGLSLSPIDARFDAKQFQSVIYSSGIADSAVTLDFMDDDGEIARLCDAYGEGVRVEIFFYFPQVGLLLSRWWGHLGTPEDTGGPRTRVPAAFGFRSSQLPLPKRDHGPGCPFTYAFLLKSQAEIDDNKGCPYNRHIAGGTIGLVDGGGNPLPTCTRVDNTECSRHFGHPRNYPGFETIVGSYQVGETKGPNILATSRGNESNLSRPVRVVFGFFKLQDLDLLAYLVEPDTNHPDKGSVKTLWAGPEGPVQNIDSFQVNDITVGFQHLNLRYGQQGQPATAFTAGINTYSFTCILYGVSQGDFRGFGYNQFRASARFWGLADIRVYTDPNTFTLQWTQSPAWCILEMLHNKRWGDGQDYSRFVIQDWIDAAAWQALSAGFLDASGAYYTSTRAMFNADVNNRTTQQQINDSCLFSGLSLPFPFQGKTRILPLKREDITQCPIFSEDMTDPTVRPILADDQGVSTLRTRKTFAEGELPNQIRLSFFDAAHDNIQRPLLFEDQAAQYAAGKAFGDPIASRRVITKPYSALGVTDFGQAVRCGNRLLDLGEFDEGGLKNNRTVTFEASFLDVCDLHKYRVIKVDSRKLDRYGFVYFRIKEMRDLGELRVQVEATAYNDAYYAAMEDVTQTPPQPSSGILPNPGGVPGARPFPLGFGSVSHTNDRINFQLARTS